MSIESLLKAILVLHHGNAKQHALLKYSLAKQIQSNEAQPVNLNGKSVATMEMIVTAKYAPFATNGAVANRTIEALLIDMTAEDEVQLVLQTNHTECPVVNGEIVVEDEKMITQVNRITTIEEYAKICKDFELYFEDGE